VAINGALQGQLRIVETPDQSENAKEDTKQGSHQDQSAGVPVKAIKASPGNARRVDETECDQSAARNADQTNGKNKEKRNHRQL
jgi:hypothetical protein